MPSELVLLLCNDSNVSNITNSSIVEIKQKLNNYVCILNDTEFIQWVSIHVRIIRVNRIFVEL